MKTTWMTRVLTIMLAVALLLTGLPEIVLTSLGLIISNSWHALADTVSEKNLEEEQGWLFARNSEGNLTLYGYSDTEVKTLTLPEKLGAGYVTGIGENAFSDLTSLYTVTVPGSIHTIAGSAFHGLSGLKIRSWTGAVALKFASGRGFPAENLSRYDLFDEFIDLAGWSREIWSYSGRTLRINQAYSSLVRAGSHLFIPGIGRYNSGLPVSATSISQDGDELVIICAEMSFENSVERLVLENEICYVDLNGIVVSDGVTMSTQSRKSRSTDTLTASVPLSFDYTIPISNAASVSGTVELKFSAKLSLDYGWFRLNKIDVELKEEASMAIKSTYGVKGKDGTKSLYSENSKDNKDIQKRLARIPLYSAGIATLNLDVDLVFNCYGEITFKISYEKTTNITWQDGNDPVTTVKKEIKDPSLSAAFTISLMLKPSLKVSIGFGDLSIDVLEVSMAVGPKVTIKTCNALALTDQCFEVKIVFTISVGVRVGILDKKDAGGGKFTGKLEFGVTREWSFDIYNKHFWTSDSRFHDECGKGESDPLFKSYTVEFNYNNGRSPEKNTVTKGLTVDRPHTPIRDGYTFVGWYINGTDTEFDFTKGVEQDYVLVARWKDIITGEEEQEEIIEPEPIVTPAPGSDTEPDDTLSIQEKSSVQYFSTHDWNLTETQPVTVLDGIVGDPTELYIPSRLNGRRVYVSTNFESCTSLKTLVFADPLFSDTLKIKNTSVETMIFNGNAPYQIDGCKSLTTLTFVNQGARNVTNCPLLKKLEFPNARIGDVSGLDALTELIIRYNSGDYHYFGGSIRNCKSLKSITFDYAGSVYLASNPITGCPALEHVYITKADFLDAPGRILEEGSSATIHLREGVSILAGANAFRNAHVDGADTIYVAEREDNTYAFRGTTGLNRVVLTEVNETTKSASFQNCDVKDLVLCPGKYPFNKFGSCTALKSVTMEGDGSKYEFASSVFQNCTALETVKLPDGLTSISNDLFRKCTSLHQIELPSTVQDIGSSAFFACTALEEIVIPEGIQMLYQSTFGNCTSLKEVTLPESLEVLKSAFYGCSSLETIEIPEAVIELDGTFENCTSLKAVKLPANLQVLKAGVFKNTAIEEITVPESVEEITNSTFTGSALVRAYFNATVEELPASIFSDCKKLQTVVISSKIHTINSYAFEKATSLTSIAFLYPDELKTIENSVFSGCSSLKRLYSLNSLESIGTRAFSDCISLEKFFFPESLETIGDYAFSGCTALKEINLDCVDLGHETFKNNTSVEIMTIRNMDTRNKIAAIGSYDLWNTFQNLKALKFVFLEADWSDENVDKTIWWMNYFADNYPEAQIIPYSSYVSDTLDVFYYDGDDGGLIYQDETVLGARLNPPAEPTREDYTFLGWSVDWEDQDNLWDFTSRRVTENDTTYNLYNDGSYIKLVANWEYTPTGFEYKLAGENAIITDYYGKQTILELPDELDGHPVTGIAKGAIGPGITGILFNSACSNIEYGAFMYASDLCVDDSIFNNYIDCRGELWVVDGMIVHCSRSETEAYISSYATNIQGIAPYAFYHSGIETLQSNRELIVAENAITSCDNLKTIIFGKITSLGEYAISECINLQEVEFQDYVIDIGNGNLLGSDAFIYGMSEDTALLNYTQKNKLKYNQYQVSFVQGGETMATYYVQEGNLVPRPSLPEEMDMVFCGWLDENGNLWNFGTDTMPGYDMELSAVWEYDYTWKSVAGGVQLLTYSGNSVVPWVPASINGEKVKSIQSNCFAGVTLQGMTGEKGSAAEIFAKEKKITFMPISHTVTFDSGVGSLVSPVTAYATELLAEPTVIASGYQLKGWYDEEGNKWNFAKSTMPEGDMKLTAKWTLVSATAVVPYKLKLVEGGVAITGYTGSNHHITIPSTVNGQAVVEISDYAFWSDETVFTATIPASVKTIGKGAFADSRVATVTIANGCSTIGESAFAGCMELSSLTLGASIKTIGDYAFADCISLSSITLPISLTALNEGVFSGCTLLGSITIPASVNMVATGAFRNCTHLTSLTIGEAVTSFSAEAISGCGQLGSITVASSNSKLKAVSGALYSADDTELIRVPEKVSAFTIPSTVTRIGEHALAGTRLSSITIPANISFLGASAFQNAKLLQTVIFASGSKLTSIGEKSFDGCQALTQLTIPDTVTSIGQAAFANCYALRKLTIPSEASVGTQAIPELDTLTVYGSTGSSADARAKEANVRFVDSVKTVELTAINLSATALELEISETAKLTAALKPANTTEKSITWVSEDPSIVEVSEGQLTAKRLGTAMVYAIGVGGISATCEVSVVRVKEKNVDISMDPLRLYLAETGDNGLITAVISPVYAPEQDVTWTVADQSIAVLVGNRVIAMGTGITTITATLANGKSSTCTVMVNVPEEEHDKIKLPTMLSVIDEEAFAGSNIEWVELGEKSQRIESRAFADCAQLVYIYIPITVTNIADNAFESSNDVVIHGKSGSIAEEYAKKLDIPFVAE